MKDTNAIEQALNKKVSNELRDIVDKFTDDIKKISNKYGGSMYYDFEESSYNEGVKFSVNGISKVNDVLHRMLMAQYGENMLNYKSKELIDKLDLI
jgi:hypothetical protein